MEELWMHWAMKFSFSAKVIFFSPRFSSCSVYHAQKQGRPLGVKALHHNNTNIRLQIPFSHVVQTVVLMQALLCSQIRLSKTIV